MIVATVTPAPTATKSQFGYRRSPHHSANRPLAAQAEEDDPTDPMDLIMVTTLVARRRRGRSPPAAPSAVDPWQTPGGDPWAGASKPVRPFAKAPRHHAIAAWSNWQPMATVTTDATATSSVTPDPPAVRRLPRILPPARSGTPPLTIAVSSDGAFLATGMWTPAATAADEYGITVFH